MTPQSESKTVKAQLKTECELDGLSDEWEITHETDARRLSEAIKKVRKNHDYDEYIPAEETTLYVYHVKWNENTDTVWIGVFGYRAGLEVQESA